MEVCGVKRRQDNLYTLLQGSTITAHVVRNLCYVNELINEVDLSCVVLQTSLSHGQPTIHKPLGHYRGSLNHYKQIGYIEMYDFEDTELYDYTKMQMCYSSQVTVILPNSSRAIIGSRCVTFPQKQLAREEAAKSAVQQLESLLPKPIPLQRQRGTVTTVMIATIHVWSFA